MGQISSDVILLRKNVQNGLKLICCQVISALYKNIDEFIHLNLLASNFKCVFELTKFFPLLLQLAI